jgi:hypothetical protein
MDNNHSIMIVNIEKIIFLICYTNENNLVDFWFHEELIILNHSLIKVQKIYYSYQLQHPSRKTVHKLKFSN